MTRTPMIRLAVHFEIASERSEPLKPRTAEKINARTMRDRTNRTRRLTRGFVLELGAEGRDSRPTRLAREWGPQDQGGGNQPSTS